MMKYCIISFFIGAFSFAQATQGSITYEMVMDFSSWKTDGELPYEIRQLIKDAAFARFTLLYNSDGMIFTDNRTDEEIEKAIFGLNPGKRYFYKKAAVDTLYIVEKMEKGSDEFIAFQYDSDWKLTKESKKINGFVCYKATRTPSPDSLEEIDKESPIIAWYTLEIPLPYGPFSYGGLPGLILELQKERSIIFRAKTMRWNDQHQIKITFPERL